ncbi:taste receptor type 2 member 4-like [Engystomops pustulosus]|uniref:taste receptor type 2 member 4-like n=1 Tax=Engystomops pustulosus TaxID=76066 RepID=UPI003AFB6720
METGELVSLLLYFISSSSGIYFNVFISVVSYRTWLSDGSLQPRGLLLFSTGLSSAIFEGYRFSVDISFHFWREDFSSLNVCTVFLHCLFTSCIFFTLCQVSLLCSFYCIKLISFQHWIIQVLKSRLPSYLPWIMAGTLVISGLGLVLLFYVIYISVPVNATNNSSFCRRINETYAARIRNMSNGFNIIIALPFCLILVSLSCTAITLVQHKRKAQGTLGLGRSHLQAHMDAATTMILLLALNMSFYVSKLLMDGNVLPFPLSMMFSVIYYLFWPLQALILIFRTKKLYERFICCSRKKI